MIKHTEFAQGSLEWLEARAGKPTASEFGNLLTDNMKIRKGQRPATYLATKLAEAWMQAQGLILEGFGAWAAEQGTILEEDVLPWLSLAHDIEVERVGFITTDDGRVGCSPDGLRVGVACGGVEAKCPQPKQHCKTLLTGAVPEEHLTQIHGGMYVTGFESWLFVSYNRLFPKLVIEVERDDEIQVNIREAVDMFLFRFDAGWKKLCEMNDGPPQRLQAKRANGRQFDNHVTYLQ